MYLRITIFTCSICLKMKQNYIYCLKKLFRIQKRLTTSVTWYIHIYLSTTVFKDIKKDMNHTRQQITTKLDYKDLLESR